VTITPSTTGTGQIGIFDTTLLTNGSYFVLLNATNSAGVTQGSQAYVTVVGDCKPGRVAGHAELARGSRRAVEFPSYFAASKKVRRQGFPCPDNQTDHESVSLENECLRR
jgi:hypothetical protein